MIKFLNYQTQGIGRASFILAASSLISAFLGLLRDRLLASRFGAGDELDIYYAAFRIPDFVSMVLIMGSISAAVIPVFTQYLVRSEKESWRFLSNLLNIFLFFLIIISLLLIIFADQLITFVAPGFLGSKKDMAVSLTRIMFFSPFLLGVSNIISSILRIFQRFLITAVSPIMYNLGIISGILLLVPIMGLKGLAWGVVFGAGIHLLVQMPVLAKIGFKPQRILDFKEPGVREVVKLTLPRSIGVAAGQVNLLAMTAIASALAGGSIAVFNLAENLSRPLLTLFGVSFSAAAMPVLSLSFSENNKEKFWNSFYSVFVKIVFFLTPFSFLIFILRAQIVRLVYGAGEFGWLDTRLTAAALGVFGFSLVAQGLSLLLAKTFYSMRNTKIPSGISFIIVIFNILASIIFVKLLSFENEFRQVLTSFLRLEGIKNIQVIGLVLAFSISAIVQFFFLFIALCRKAKFLKLEEIFVSVKNILLASLTMGIFAYLVRQIMADIVDMQTFLGIFEQTLATSFISSATYFLIAHFLGIPEFKSLWAFVFGRFNNPS